MSEPNISPKDSIDVYQLNREILAGSIDPVTMSPDSVMAMQEHLGVPIDGNWGADTQAEFDYMNTPAVDPEPNSNNLFGSIPLNVPIIDTTSVDPSSTSVAIDTTTAPIDTTSIQNDPLVLVEPPAATQNILTMVPVPSAQQTTVVDTLNLQMTDIDSYMVEGMGKYFSDIATIEDELKRASKAGQDVTVYQNDMQEIMLELEQKLEDHYDQPVNAQEVYAKWRQDGNQWKDINAITEATHERDRKDLLADARHLSGGGGIKPEHLNQDLWDTGVGRITTLLDIYDKELAIAEKEEADEERYNKVSSEAYATYEKLKDINPEGSWASWRVWNNWQNASNPIEKEIQRHRDLLSMTHGQRPTTALNRSISEFSEYASVEPNSEYYHSLHNWHTSPKLNVEEAVKELENLLDVLLEESE